MPNNSPDFAMQNTALIRSILEELVNIESPSTDKAAVDRLGGRILQELEACGGETRIFRQEHAGNHLRAQWGHGPGGCLVVCHMDTVFDLGTLAQRPFREAQGNLYGPGVLDMKSGIALLLGVLHWFKQTGTWPERPLTALFTSDEETGSLTSRSLIEAEARQAGVVFCLEPALASGALKTARKGTGEIELRVKGAAAHAGVDHEKGRNAIEELAHHVLSAQRLTDYPQGTTVNVGVIGGGTRTNVVPEDAYALIDFRVASIGEVERLKAWAESRVPILEGTRVSANLDLNRPPMPRDDTMQRTYEKASSIAGGIGLRLSEGSTGGGSDANFVAALGVPVLDGLGAVGDGAHSEREYVRIDSLSERAALLAALLREW